MEVITTANEANLKILKNFNKTDNCRRMMHYCVHTEVEEGILLFNLLTREMLLLSQDEFAHICDLEYLKKHWFVVPEDAKEKEYADLVKWVLKTRQRKPDAITRYTIFPTTDCNARCFYCFELGRSRIPMSHETALKVVQYIKTHCGDKKVKLNWFGGEPLYNQDAIDTICAGLQGEGIEYSSFVVSNGYLFDAATVKKAAENWNVKKVQITLDGTEDIYNRTKAFVYRDGSPYRTVLTNIERLLDASIGVSIRLNMDLYNAENLLLLTDELAQRFDGKKNICVYVYHLFEGNTPMAELHSHEEWDKREQAMCRIEEKLKQSGLMAKGRISEQIKLTQCIADDGKSVTIMPDGHIGLCEHFTETEFIGHIDQEGFDENVVASWKETIPLIPECAECFCYPDCVKLKKCGNHSVCFLHDRQAQLRKVQYSMESKYKRWKECPNQDNEEDGSTIDC